MPSTTFDPSLEKPLNTSYKDTSNAAMKYMEEKYARLVELERLKNTVAQQTKVATPIPTNEQLINIRLRLSLNAQPFEFLHAYRMSPEKVVVFIVNKGDPLTLEDDGLLFPSDQLITKLRLIMPEQPVTDPSSSLIGIDQAHTHTVQTINRGGKGGAGLYLGPSFQSDYWL
jgi:hypothetical protein